LPEARLRELDAQPLGALEDRSPGDAAHRALDALGGEEPALRYDEDVIRGAFRDMPRLVEHEGLEASGADGLDFCQHVIEVVEALDAHVEGGGAYPAEARRDELDALLIVILGIQGDVAHDHDDARLGAEEGVHPEVAHAPRDDEADIAIALPVLGDATQHEGFHIRGPHGDLEHQGLGARVEALDMLGELEDLARVDAEPLEDAVAVEEAVIEHRYFRLVLIVHLAVDIDPHRSSSSLNTFLSFLKEGPPKRRSSSAP